MTLRCELVSPEKLEFSSEAGMVVVPGVEGEIGVLENHAPLIASLRPGMVTIHSVSGQEKAIRRFITGGFVEITAERCVVLAEDISDPANLSRAEVQIMLDEARADLSEAETPQDIHAAARRIEEAEALLLML